MATQSDAFILLEELNAAEVFLIQPSQQRSFASENKSIKGDTHLQVSKSLITLHPDLTEGLLRVGGRTPC